MSIPYVNGEQHSWASIAVNALGRTFTGITAINYSDSVDIQNQYGAGQHVDHQGVGNYEATASMELYQYEIVALQRAAGGARIQQIPPFDITVSYKPTLSAPAVNDVIRNCRIKTNNRNLTQGDPMSKVSVELIVTHIDWDGQLPGVGVTI